MPLLQFPLTNFSKKKIDLVLLKRKKKANWRKAFLCLMHGTGDRKRDKSNLGVNTEYKNKMESGKWIHYIFFFLLLLLFIIFSFSRIAHFTLISLAPLNLKRDRENELKSSDFNLLNDQKRDERPIFNHLLLREQGNLSKCLRFSHIYFLDDKNDPNNKTPS